jgi:hypothetical protein
LLGSHALQAGISTSGKPSNFNVIGGGWSTWNRVIADIARHRDIGWMNFLPRLEEQQNLTTDEHE